MSAETASSVEAIWISAILWSFLKMRKKKNSSQASSVAT